MCLCVLKALNGSLSDSDMRPKPSTVTPGRPALPKCPALDLSAVSKTMLTGHVKHLDRNIMFPYRENKFL